MTIARILAGKGADVATISPGRTLLEVAAELSERGIGALVVLDGEGEVIGVIAERDIVNAVAQHGASALSDEVFRHMVAARTIALEDSVDSAMETMTVERRRHLPVLHEGRLAGIVSIGDVVKYRIDTIETERLALREYITSA